MPHARRNPNDPDPPFLQEDPPHWIARGLSTLLLALFVAALLIAALVHIPETVTGAFVLVPEHGADPVRAAREGTIIDVRTNEGEHVAKGATLFMIRSQAIGDRAADMRGLEVQHNGSDQRLVNAQAERASQQRSDDVEAKRLEAKLASLERVAALKRKQLGTARDIADRSKRGAQQGVVASWDSDRFALDADQLATEVEFTGAEQEETRAALAKLRQDTLTRAVQYRELVRTLEQDRELSRTRLESMRGQINGVGGDLVITSPCDGTMLRMMVSTTGAVVQAGDALGEVACAGQRLQIEMDLGQQAVARVRAGQGAKLLYDAFPYQRYGVKFGLVRWVGPASVVRSAGATPDPREFRALIDAADSAIFVRGEARPLLAGMRGTARVVTGDRTLISFAFEPIRALRENLSEPPRRS
ncbi:MAG TPA: HlyD family efflux transporter periplasmic adaptor subunit [Gemmatimonadaceae bacterium]|jgi:multidrug resistance efflux pump